MQVYYTKGLHKIVYIGHRVGTSKFRVKYILTRNFNQYHAKSCDFKIPYSRDGVLENFDLPEKFLLEIRRYTRMIPYKAAMLLNQVDRRTMQKTSKELTRKFDRYLVYNFSDYAGMTHHLILVDNITGKKIRFCIEEEGSWNLKNEEDTPETGIIKELSEEEWNRIMTGTSMEDFQNYAKVSMTLIRMAEVVLGLDYRLNLPKEV